MIDATFNTTTTTYREDCDNCQEINGMNDGSFPHRECDHHDAQELVTVVTVQISVNGADYGSKSFYSFHGADPHADAAAYIAPIRAAFDTANAA